MAWQFKREETEFEELAEGRYRVAIVDAQMAVSKSGNDMLVIKLLVSGTRRNLWNYITFLDDRPEITNRMLTQFFDSFGIEDGNFNLNSYVGKSMMTKAGQGFSIFCLRNSRNLYLHGRVRHLYSRL